MLAQEGHTECIYGLRTVGIKKPQAVMILPAVDYRLSVPVSWNH